MNSVLVRLRHFLNDKERKGFFRIIWDVFVLTIKKRGFPFYYFGRMVYRRDAGDCRNYFSTREYYRVIDSKKFNDPEFNSIMHNKLMLSFFCKELQIPSPKLMGYNFREHFYTEGGCRQITHLKDLSDFFSEIALQNKVDRIFVKPQMSKGGKGAFLLKIKDLEQQLEKHGQELFSGFFVFQASIDQHPEISLVYPHSVNTLRISTYRDNEGILHTLPTVMRFGMGGSVMDNKSSGGLYLITDQLKGCLTKFGRTGLATGSTDYTCHPDTGITFLNYRIPYYYEAHSFCEKLAGLLPNRFTGWDIAITPEGPLLVEANANPNFLLGELENGGYLQYPVYQKIISEK